ncbi:RsmB/NOP family class I SAM-dependent RNA methyltransferase [Rhizobium rhizogenes]|uniref:RsmB/NOP family class I SAM-dependent RNA methyltransferase n=1 Tax=Rhizobium rhizogenes TaxID=359 RepID=UPI0035AC1963
MVLSSDNKNKHFNKDGKQAGNRSGQGRPRDSVSSKPGFAARAAAAKILSAVIDRKTPLDGMLDAEGGNPAYKALGDSDRALVRAILNSALRHLPRIEAAIASLLDSPLPEGARALHHVLVVGAAQMLYLDVPDHSAVDIAVEQANQDPRNRRFAKLVNAILRRIGREKQDILSQGADVPAMPKWFLTRLEAAYGRQAALKISDTQLEPAAIDVTVKSDAEGWAKRLNGVVLPTGGVRLAAFEGSIPSLDGFADGEWWVQDAAASIPAKLFGSLAGQRVVDLCAAPGGKTAQLILAGGKVTALDQSANRLKRLSGNLARLGLEAETVVADMAKFQPDDLFDAALLDAPCSSTGTTRRHPDVLWTKGPEDIAKLAALQERLLRHALTLVKPGGLVVFSNCSLDPEEGEDLVARVLSETDMAERVAITPEDWPGLEAAISPLGAFRTTPDMLPLSGGFASGLDGFFAVVLRRTH